MRAQAPFLFVGKIYEVTLVNFTEILESSDSVDCRRLLFLAGELLSGIQSGGFS